VGSALLSTTYLFTPADTIILTSPAAAPPPDGAACQITKVCYMSGKLMLTLMRNHVLPSTDNHGPVRPLMSTIPGAVCNQPASR
jgi:hypothetical protein